MSSKHRETKYIKCLNCSEYGHLFKNCKNPIVSYGIIGYRVINGILKFMMIQRKDTMGYTDLVRGKYKEHNKIELTNIFVQEATPLEKQKLKTLTFDQIWNDLWICKKSGIYVTEYERAKAKFNRLDMDSLPLNEPSRYLYQEYGFPKGRKNISESHVNCAIREFTEETGFNKKDIRLEDMEPLVESFVGSNGIHYTHIYYIARVISNKIPRVDKKNLKQMEEVNKVDYYEYKDAYKLLRDYDIQKKHILYTANSLLLKKLKIIHRKT